MNNKKSLYVKIDNSCNMSCTYCYCKNNLKRSCSIKDGFLHLSNIIINNNIEHITFVGGEPLLYIDDIIKLIDHIQENRIDITINFLTNGTIYERRLKKYRNIITSFQISIDGGQKANINRLFKDGSETYNTIINNIKKYYNDGINVTINSVIYNARRWKKTFFFLLKDIDNIPMQIGISLPLFKKKNAIKTIATVLAIIGVEKKAKNTIGENFTFNSSMFHKKLDSCSFGIDSLALSLESKKLFPCPIMIDLDETEDQFVGSLTGDGINVDYKKLEKSLKYADAKNYSINHLPNVLSKRLLKHARLIICHTDNKVSTGSYFKIPLTNIIISFILRFIRG